MKCNIVHILFLLSVYASILDTTISLIVNLIRSVVPHGITQESHRRINRSRKIYLQEIEKSKKK